MTRRDGPFAIALCLTAACAAWIYWPGVQSAGFLFDDYANLPALGNYGEIDSLQVLITYLTAGIAGPTGRPISLLSFLVDARNWPAEAAPFLRTNLVLHLVNGLLLAFLLRRLCLRTGLERRHAGLAAALAAGLWLLHPLWVSTVLYAVQRMAILAATFSLGGLYLALRGRELLASRPTAALLLLAGGIGGGTLLAGLSKENGLLLPLLALALFATVYADDQDLDGPARRRWRGAHLLLLQLPSLVIAGYLLWSIPGGMNLAERLRPYTLLERILTEGRILLDYVGWLVVPSPVTGGPFQDGFPVSSGLLSPPSTLFAWFVVAAALAAAIRYRRRAPLAAGTVLFFLAGHVLESTVIPLELRFEHRNYLPAALLFLPLTAHGAWRGRGRLAAGVAVCVLAAVAAVAWLRVDLWSSPLERALTWAAVRPDSARAQTYAALVLADSAPARAERMLAQSARRFPESAMVQLNRLTQSCSGQIATPGVVEDALRALRMDPRAEPLAYSILGRLAAARARGDCRALAWTDLDRLVQAALDNPAIAGNPGRVQSLLLVAGRVDVETGRAHDAVSRYAQAVMLWPRFEVLLTAAASLGSAGYPALGLRLLDACSGIAEAQPAESPIRHVHHLWLRHIGYYQREMEHLRSTLLRNAERVGLAGPADGSRGSSAKGPCAG